MFYLLDDA
jgi:hypothetical protein